MKSDVDICVLPDSTGLSEPLIVEKNWNEYVGGAKAYRFKLGDNEIIVESRFVESLFFLLGDEVMRDKIFDCQNQKIPELVSVLNVPVVVKATRAIPAGGYIRTTAHVNIPEKIKEFYQQKYAKRGL